ncbi:hypothetical protein [uncultured Croceitalea sp.]|uniref:hypothetical protein n=1 Tax=uncultured Croceitalea sp. TaxID=1798908 RepID=UPI00330669AD
MKKIAVIFLFLMFLTQVEAQVDRDKVLHFLGGNLYGLAGAGIAKQISDGNRWWTFAGAVGGSALIGLGKEAVDASQRENGWDNNDLLATILGGATVGVTIDIFTDHKKDKNRKAKAIALTVTDDMMEWERTSLTYINKSEKLPSLYELSLPQDLLLLSTY